MRVPSQLQRTPVGFNMTPMIDVVFLLIIFFLVSSHLAKQEAQMELPLPRAESGEDEPDRANRRITLNVQRDGELLFAGRPIAVDALTERLSAARTKEEEAVQIRIRSDRATAYRHVEPIMLACARAGIWDVSFAVVRPEDAR